MSPSRIHAARPPSPTIAEDAESAGDAVAGPPSDELRGAATRRRPWSLGPVSVVAALAAASAAAANAQRRGEASASGGPGPMTTTGQGESGLNEQGIMPLLSSRTAAQADPALAPQRTVTSLDSVRPRYPQTDLNLSASFRVEVPQEVRVEGSFHDDSYTSAQGINGSSPTAPCLLTRSVPTQQLFSPEASWVDDNNASAEFLADLFGPIHRSGVVNLTTLPDGLINDTFLDGYCSPIGRGSAGLSTGQAAGIGVGCGAAFILALVFLCRELLRGAHR